MTLINLLPWRSAQRETLQKKFLITLTTTVFLCLVTLGIAHVIIKNQLEHKKNKTSFLKKEIIRVDTQLAKIGALKKQEKQLLSRIKNLQTLQRHLENGSD
jgi:Tfp pilus assembly protein PilN